MADTLNDLFPPPSSHGPTRPPSAPRTWPGITPTSTESLQHIMKDSSKRWHVFFMRDYRPHNHSVHSALALWAMGADDDVINAMYKLDTQIQMPVFPSPGEITKENWRDNLGNDEWYSAYLSFFREVVREKGVAGAVEEYVFSRKANFMPKEELKEGQEQPEMVNRFMDGIIHPLIHVGNGIEFGVPGLVAEGLAWTAVHFTSSSAVMPASLWETIIPTLPVQSLTSRFLTLGKKPQESKAPKKNTHALTILARILKDSRFDDVPAAENYAVVYENSERAYGEAIEEYVKQWSYDTEQEGELERKIEELVWACVAVYGISGWAGGEVLGQGAFNADFFHVHFVTAAMFVPSIASVLTPASQELLLRTFFAVCITWWVGRNRPPLPISKFYDATATVPEPIYSRPPVHKDAFPAKNGLVNPWFELMAESMVLPDDHFPKALRALAHFADVYGGRVAGKGEGKPLAETELEGADGLDGTLFIRAAILTNERLRTVRDCEVGESKYWERRGFYKSDAGVTVRGLPEKYVWGGQSM